MFKTGYFWQFWTIFEILTRICLLFWKNLYYTRKILKITVRKYEKITSFIINFDCGGDAGSGCLGAGRWCGTGDEDGITGGSRIRPIITYSGDSAAGGAGGD